MVTAHVYVDPPELDRSVCAYYQRYIGAWPGDPNGTCSFVCQDEPGCVTDQPQGGWPAERRAYTRADTAVVIR